MSQVNDPDSALLSAVLEGSADDVRTALAAGADPDRTDANGWSPLIWAAGAGSINKVSLLLDAGANPLLMGDGERTAYLVAVAAGRREVAELLAAAEAERGGDQNRCSSRRHETRPYCRAFQSRELRRFPGWREAPLACAEPRPSHIDDDLLRPIADDDVLFLHRDLHVTRSVFADELVVFGGTAPGWAEFCAEVLRFRPMDDRDWMPPGATG